ncbi:histidine phosphatase family protein [Bacillus sp. AK031]
METNLYFVRHAHSRYTPEELTRPLSAKGFDEAMIVTEKLAGENLDVFISSPFLRAVQTIQGAAEHFGSEIVVRDGFRERLLSEKPVEDFDAAITKVWSEWDFSWEGGESNTEAQKRGVRATLEVLDEFSGKNIVIGTHGNIMVLIMNYFDSRFDFEFWGRLGMPDIYRLTFEGHELVKVDRVFE